MGKNIESYFRVGLNLDQISLVNYLFYIDCEVMIMQLVILQNKI